jgi:alkanesulfonate monooxygenase SsuD/methylene tetrahydromethanopterin reductase-like flavin-dependent oxidoreductase (luciferase family)
MSRELRFGVLILQNLPYLTLVDWWQQVEVLGFDSLWVADHFVEPRRPKDIWFDGWTLLAAMATHTSGIRIGTLVTSITLRNPAVVAKEAMTIDHISGGRLQLGIGAGRTPLDHSMTGTEATI